MTATQKADIERLALAVRRARQEAAPSEEDRLIAAGWGDVPGTLIPAEVRRIAREGIGEVPRYSAPARKKTGRKPAKPLAKSRWFKAGEKPKVLNRRKETTVCGLCGGKGWRPISWPIGSPVEIRPCCDCNPDGDLPQTEEERLMDSWDDEPIYFQELGDAGND